MKGDWIWSYICEEPDGTYTTKCFENMEHYGFNSHFISSIINEIVMAGGKRLKILFNSQGGDALEGISVYNILANAPIEIEGIVVGIAASAAAIAYQGCKIRTMYPHSLIMVHRVSLWTTGDPDKVINDAESAIIIENQTKDILIKHTGQTQEVVETWFDGSDHWFAGADSLQNGLCTRVIDNDIIPDATTISQQRNVPKVWQSYQTQYIQFESVMLKKRVIQLLNLSQSATDEEVIAALENLPKTDKKEELASKEAEIDALKAKVKAFEEKEAAQAAAQEQEATIAVEQAFTLGQITQVQKDAYTKLVKTSPLEVIQLVTNTQSVKMFAEKLDDRIQTPVQLHQSAQNYYQSKNQGK